jgi:hypothetical protein
MIYKPVGNFTPPDVSQSSVKAVVSLIFGILGFVFLPLIGPIVALAVGYSAKTDIRKSGGRLTGDGMATAGIVLGWVNIGLWVLIACVEIAMVMLLYNNY